MERNWELLEKLAKLRDDDKIGVNEAAAITDFAPASIRQHRVNGFPPPLPGPRALRWNIGDIRAWGNRPTIEATGVAAYPASIFNVKPAKSKVRSKRKVNGYGADE